MKSGNREVNIFNMSLLDILCGALGAFCFLTITLFPHYKPNSAALNGSQQSVEQMQEQIKKLMEQLGSGGGAGALQQLQQIQDQLRQLQDQLAKARKDLDDAKKQADDLIVRRPVVVTAHWSEPVDVDLYIQDGSKKMAPPTLKERQWAAWNGDVATDRKSAPAFEVWFMRDVPSGVYKVHLKLMGEIQPAAQATVWLFLMYQNTGFNLGSVTLNSQQRIVTAVDLVMDPNGNLTYRPQPGLAIHDDLKKKLAQSPSPR